MPQQTDAMGFPIVGSRDTAPTPATAPATSPSTDSMGFALVGTQSSSPTSSTPETPSTAATPATDSMGFAIVGGNPTSAPVQKTDNDNQSLLGKVWSWASKPLVDIDDALGRTGQASGLERGASDLVSGLTSPLSIALTVGTLGTGGLVESGAMSVLREAGIVGATSLADITKGAQIVSDVAKTARSFEDGLAAAKAAGVNPDTLVKGLDALKDAGLGTDSLTSNGLIRRGGAAGLRSLGVGAANAEKVSAGLQAMVGAGFTAQNAYQAAELSPKVLDALKDGDYDTAVRLGVNALGKGALAGIGAHELASESGSLMDAAKAKAGLEVNPTETNLELQRNAGILKRDVDTAGFTNTNWAQDVRKLAPKATPEQLQRIKYYVEAGGDEDLMAQRHNIIAEIAGMDDSAPVASPENGQPVTTGMTPERVQELVDSKQMADKYTPAELTKLKDAYNPRKLTDTDRTVAQQILDKHNETLEEAQKNDLLGEGVKNYSTNIWKPEDQNNGAANRLAHDANSGMFAQNTSQARARMFDSAFEGQLLGKKLAETDPISLAANNANSFARVKAARNFRERLLDQGTQASDGAPIAAISGTAHYDPETGNAMVNSSNLRNIKIADPVIQGLKDNGQLDRLIENGQIVDLTPKITPENIQQNIDALEQRSISAPITYDAGGNSVMGKQIQQLKDVQSGKLPMSTLDSINDSKPSVYAWNTDNYASIDHPMLRGVKHVLTTPSGDNVFVKGDVRVHPEAQEYLERILGTDTKGPGEGPIGKVAGKLGREAKGILLFGSPFHIFQEGLRGIITGVSPFGLDKIDLASNPVLANGVEHGLTLGQDHRGLAAFKDGELRGNSKIISKVPGLNRIQSGVDHFLFDKYVPTLKARSYPKLVEDYKAAYPEWTDEKVADTAAAHANELFGGINYQQLGRSAATQNWARLLLLAPDWLEGEVRSIVRPFGTEGKVARSQMLKATVGLWTTSRILNYLNTGQFHNEAPFGVVVKGDDGKEKVYSIRTLPTDTLHAVSDPLGFIKGRLSPNVHALAQFATGRDDQGHKIAKSGLALDLLNSAAPIPIQSAVQAASGNL